MQGNYISRAKQRRKFRFIDGMAGPGEWCGASQLGMAAVGLHELQELFREAKVRAPMLAGGGDLG